MQFKSKFTRRAVRAFYVSLQSLCLSAALGLVAPAQTPPNKQGQRGLGIPAPTPTPTQTQAQPQGQTSTRPELVLQTGYPFIGATGLTYSPDGRLLATTTPDSNQIKLWETATGRELRTLAIGGGTGGFLNTTFMGV
ncbi:MAG TPA: hypothetical protein VE821_02765, partial [Pyrinomonadaceae bacterium]|nr:hypothetical protein [Pyrinomonadaceae bacterium]